MQPHLAILCFSAICAALAAESIAQSVASMVGRRQSVGVRGRLLCGTHPLADTRVKLWEEDSGPDPDDLMGETRTNDSGYFEVWGSQTEITNIDPRLKIYHTCDHKGPCKRKVTFTIPNSYINKSPKVEKWFEFGSLNMQLIHRKEGTQCF